MPFLGVCLGMQLLFESSEEDPGVPGLGLVRGDVRLLPSTVKVPHIGWNQAHACTCSDLLDGIPDGSAFYFVHSYAVVPRSPADVLTMTDYGVNFVSGVEVGQRRRRAVPPGEVEHAGPALLPQFRQAGGLSAHG